MKIKFKGQEIVVVTKTARDRQRRIPRVDEKARLEAIKKEEAALQQLCRGTTPTGRDLLTKLLLRCEKLLRGGKTVYYTAVEIEPEISQFEMLREEWSILICRLWRRWDIHKQELREGRALFFALTVAMLAHEARVRRDAGLTTIF